MSAGSQLVAAVPDSAGAGQPAGARYRQTIFSVVSLAFASVTSMSLPLDCALSEQRINTALERTLIHLALPPLVLILLVCAQLVR